MVKGTRKLAEKRDKSVKKEARFLFLNSYMCSLRSIHENVSDQGSECSVLV